MGPAVRRDGAFASSAHRTHIIADSPSEPIRTHSRTVDRLPIRFAASDPRESHQEARHGGVGSPCLALIAVLQRDLRSNPIFARRASSAPTAR